MVENFNVGKTFGFEDENVKLFTKQDFAYHKVKVVFWQTDERDQPALITEPYEKAFTATNVKKEQDFYESDIAFRVSIKVKGTQRTVEFTVEPEDNATKKFKEALAGPYELVSVEWTHRHYVKDDEYIPYCEDIAAFLKREIAKPIIRWEETQKDGKTILGYEILPNKYFYRYQPPTPAKDLLAQFWKLEEEAETMLERLAKMTLGQDNAFTELPEEWCFDRFKDVATLRSERTDETSEIEDYLELEDLDSGTGQILNRRNTLETVSDVTIFKKGDVLFGKLRPYLEKYCLADFDGKCTGEILAFRPDRINGRFLFYCIASRWFIERCNMLAYGAKMPRVSWPKQLSQFNLPIPPMPEQDRIVKYLDSSCKAIDAAVSAKYRQLDALGALRTTLIYDAVTSGINPAASLVLRDTPSYGPAPKHWKRGKLRYEITIQSGDFASDLLQDDGIYPIFGGNGVMGRADTYNVDGETVVIGRVGAYCGNAHYVQGKAWVHALSALPPEPTSEAGDGRYHGSLCC